MNIANVSSWDQDIVLGVVLLLVLLTGTLKPENIRGSLRRKRDSSSATLETAPREEIAAKEQEISTAKESDSNN